VEEVPGLALHAHDHARGPDPGPCLCHLLQLTMIQYWFQGKFSDNSEDKLEAIPRTVKRNRMLI